MRLAMAVVAIFLCSCTNIARTVTEPPPPRRARDGSTHQAAYVLAPTYPDDRALVFLACQRAALAYFGHVDAQDDAAGRLSIHDHNAWFGGSLVEVSLLSVPEGTQVGVEVDAKSAELFTDREGMVLERYVARVDLEMQTVRSLRAAMAQPTSTGAGAEAGTTGLAGGSATLRP